MVRAFLAALVLAAASPFAAATELGIQDSRFTLNGQPAFLVGISYYGGLGASRDTVQRDLDDIQRAGFNWIRVWATWGGFGAELSAVESDGSPREPFLGRLKWLVDQCDRRGIIVDVTLSRGKEATGKPRLQALAGHTRAVETIVASLGPRRNWYLDLGNERNVGDARFVSFDDLKRLRETAARFNPSLLVTASQGSDISREELNQYLLFVRVDFIAPHRPRDAGSAGQTAAKTREYLAWMKEFNRVVPVHYQEPFRRGYGKWEPKAEDFLTDLRQARSGGAAGWCLHNGDTRSGPDGEPRRSFDLRKKRLFDQLDGEEQRVIQSLAK